MSAAALPQPIITPDVKVINITSKINFNHSHLLNDLLNEKTLQSLFFMDIYEVQGPQLLNLNLENICLEDHKNIFFVKINP